MMEKDINKHDINSCNVNIRSQATTCQQLKNELDAAVNNLKIEINTKESKSETSSTAETTELSINDLDQIDQRFIAIESRVENVEIQDRETVVIVDGVYPEPNKQLSSAVQKQLNSYMDVQLKDEEIIQCSYIGKQPDGGRLKSIKVRLNDRRLKKVLMKKEGQLKTSKIYVKEFLTSRNNTIYHLAREATSFRIRHHVWTDGD